VHTAFGEGAGEKFLQRGLELLLAARLNTASYGNVNGLWTYARNHIKIEN